MATRSFPRGGAGRIVREIVSGKMEKGEWRVLVGRFTVEMFGVKSVAAVD